LLATILAKIEKDREEILEADHNAERQAIRIPPRLESWHVIIIKSHSKELNYIKVIEYNFLCLLETDNGRGLGGHQFTYNVTTTVWVETVNIPK
jgi:hypothetical protein